MGIFLEVVKLLLALAIVIIWIISLVTCDKSEAQCNSSDCPTCPFPCDQHKKGRTK